MTSFTLKYFQLGPLAARGGVQRFFMLTHDIPFQDQLFVLGGPEWPVEKTRMVQSGENPCGTLPVTTMTNQDGTEHFLSQHIATCRYLAHLHNITSGDAYTDYIQDAVADEYHGWASSWVAAAFFKSNEEKEAYKSGELVEQLTKFNALYKKYVTTATSPFLSVTAAGKPLWGDSAVFGLLHDHFQAGLLTEEVLQEYPHLANLYQAYGSIEAVAKWIENNKK